MANNDLTGTTGGAPAVASGVRVAQAIYQSSRTAERVDTLSETTGKRDSKPAYTVRISPESRQMAEAEFKRGQNQDAAEFKRKAARKEAEFERRQEAEAAEFSQEQQMEAAAFQRRQQMELSSFRRGKLSFELKGGERT